MSTQVIWPTEIKYDQGSELIDHELKKSELKNYMGLNIN